ncbi:MAG TPA: response regulator [Bryobacteraceae bacterium]|nr:response regulator [Bryobacteraceae bacterium]
MQKKSTVRTTPQSAEVLVVDDDEQVLNMILFMLRRHKLEAKGARNSAAALQLVKDHPHAIRAAIINLFLPEISGAELAVRITADYPEIGIVIISGVPLEIWPAREREMLSRLPRGFVFARKPVLVDTLLARVRFVQGDVTFLRGYCPGDSA